MTALGIPTEYGGIRFRSRVEARWAAFFDRLDWPWQYEPCDLAGYIPDFVLMFSSPLLVEVKADLIPSSLRRYTAKVEASRWEHEALIVGGALFDAERWPHLQVLGLLGERLSEDDGGCPPGWAWGSAITSWCLGCNRPSFRHECHGWQCRVDGCYDGDSFLGDPGDTFTAAWRHACRVTQWNGTFR